MDKCVECGTRTVKGEAYCSNCGMKHPVATSDPEEPDTLGYEDESAEAAAAAKSAEEPDTLADEYEAQHSLGGGGTGDVPAPVKRTVKKGNTGGHQASIQQLDPGSVLNGRYEIVRRIGGGGM